MQVFYNPFIKNSPPQSPLLKQFESLIEEKSNVVLSQMLVKSRKITEQYFGKVMHLFSPLYISNECINNCSYCGFSRDNPIIRTTLPIKKVEEEAYYLYQQGFRNILLLAGEHPKFVDEGYLQACITALKKFIPSIGIEIGPMQEKQYIQTSKAGAETILIYQETYDPKIYAQLHTSGPKKNFNFRLKCPERAYAGGFRKIGLGSLFGLSNWKKEALALASHLEYLYQTCWKSEFSISFPRMQPYANNYEYQPNPHLYLNDKNLIQLICAFRICFPRVNIVISTRESPILRNHLIGTGITHMSAGSKTNPGGYTGVKSKNLHFTVGAKQSPIDEKENKCQATEQFSIQDKRNVREITFLLKNQGYDLAWKDWQQGIYSKLQ